MQAAKCCARISLGTQKLTQHRFSHRRRLVPGDRQCYDTAYFAVLSAPASAPTPVGSPRSEAGWENNYLLPFSLLLDFNDLSALLGTVNKGVGEVTFGNTRQ